MKTQTISNTVRDLLAAHYSGDIINVESFYEMSDRISNNQAFVLQEQTDEYSYDAIKNIIRSSTISIFVRNTDRRNAELKAYEYMNYIIANHELIDGEYCVLLSRIINEPYLYSRTDQGMYIYNVRIELKYK